MIVGLVAMYMPNENEVENIIKYINELDYCYLLDDSAVDNSRVVQLLLDRFEGKVEYYLNPYNMGLVASINNGFKMAINRGASWILVMNPDGTFKNDAIAVYRKFILENDTEKVGIIAPRFNIDRRQRQEGRGTSQIKYPDMSGCLYNAKILENLGFYDQNTFFYGLDVEYCIRVRKNGFKKKSMN